MKTEIISVHDSYGFHYDVTLDHIPHYGFSTAYYNGIIIGQAEAWKLREPILDDDAEWERYWENFSEWRDSVLTDLKPKCVEYFDRM